MATTTRPTLWRLVPAARPDDPTWLDLDIWQEVVVRADTAAEARVEAGRMSYDPDDPLGSLEKADREAGFMSEKLYHVLPLPEDEAKAFGAGPKGVLRAVKAEAGG